MARTRKPNQPADLPPELEVELKGLDAKTAELLCRPLAGDPQAAETIRTGLSLIRDIELAECHLAFGLLDELPPGPLRAWWLRAVYDLPGWTAPLGRTVSTCLSSKREGREVALELIKKSSAILRAMDRSTGRALLELTAELARAEPIAGLNLFLSAQELLGSIPPRHRAGVLKAGLKLIPSAGGTKAAVVLVRRAGQIIGQAGWIGFGRWFRAGLEQPPEAREAYYDLASPASLRALDAAAGGIGLVAAAEVLRLYGRAVTGRPVNVRPLSRKPEAMLISPLALGGRLDDTAYLPEREHGRRPLAVFRARLAVLLTAEVNRWDFLLSFDDPWLAADLWALAAEARAAKELAARRPGLAGALRELNRLRRKSQPAEGVLLHPALRAAALRLWGGRPRTEDAEVNRLARETAEALIGAPDLKAGIRTAYDLLTGPKGRSVHPFKEEREKPRFKFGKLDRELFEAQAGLSPDQSVRAATLHRKSGRGEFLASLSELSEKLRRGETEDDERRAGVFLYPEWDHRLQDHRPDWVRVVESAPWTEEDGPGEAYRPASLSPGLIHRVRRQFQRLRPKDLERLTRQLDGQEVDIQAAVEWAVDRLRGESAEEKVYLSRRLIRREVVCGLLIDLSGSTGERLNGIGPSILETAKDGVWLLAEALNSLGDDFGVFGFTGSGRHRVEFTILKDFNEYWSSRTRARLTTLTPGRQNRDGAAVRHAAQRLKSHPARRKILIFLSDGRPDDYDYSGEYAIMDTRAALLETRQAGIKTFCLTIDRRARDYIAQMMGSTGYCILDDVRRLPEFLPRLYRRLAG